MISFIILLSYEYNSNYNKFITYLIKSLGSIRAAGRVEYDYKIKHTGEP